MKAKNRWSVSLLAASATLGCGSAPTEQVASLAQPINACNETVPTNRFVDGFPAYAQCDATTNGNIYSNNGVDTATSSQGSDWVLTQRGGGYQCTEWAHRYLLFRWKLDYQHGDAKDWCNGTLPSSLLKTTTPTHGDLIVFDAGVCGSDTVYGHVAVIDVVDTANVTFVEQNNAGRRSSKQSCALCFLHATANNGTGGANGAGGSAGSSGRETGGSSGEVGGLVGAGGGAASTAGTGGSTAHGTGGAGGAGTGGVAPVVAGGTANTLPGGTLSSGGAPTFGGVPGTGGAVSTPVAGADSAPNRNPTTLPPVSGCSLGMPGSEPAPHFATFLASLLGILVRLSRRQSPNTRRLRVG